MRKLSFILFLFALFAFGSVEADARGRRGNTNVVIANNNRGVGGNSQVIAFNQNRGGLFGRRNNTSLIIANNGGFNNGFNGGFNNGLRGGSFNSLNFSTGGLVGGPVLLGFDAFGNPIFANQPVSGGASFSASSSSFRFRGGF